MSIRIFAQRLLQNGRILIRSLRYNEHYYSTRITNIHPNKIRVIEVDKPLSQLSQGSKNVTNTRTLTYIGAQARRLFVNNILNRVTNSLAGELRKKATNRLLLGDSRPFFALVGVSLASGTGILTKDEELEGVCWEIRDAISKLQWTKPQNDKSYDTTDISDGIVGLKDFVVGPVIAKGCSAVVHAVRLKEKSDNCHSDEPLIACNTEISNFPLAIKMMFNYDAESNAMSILKAMFRETVPTRQYHQHEELADWEVRMANNKRILPPHPNIVAMYCVFADRVPHLPGSSRLYPDALPARINPDGSGRNMSLFLLMKRYDITLKQYMLNCDINIRESILLLAQLLEGVAHLNLCEIAHRDLKSDNILLDLSEELDNCPSLVITDFGCCLADKYHGLYLPYNSHDVDKGGNTALMAPEVITVEPGPFTRINYTKSDLWTVGTIAYEIFGLKNPFYGSKDEKPALKNYNYVDHELPLLPETVPHIITELIKNILCRNIHKRLNTEMAATIIQLYLWAPSSWLMKTQKIPSSNEILQWLLCLTTKVLCEGREIKIPNSDSSLDKNTEPQQNIYQRMFSNRSHGRRTMPEYQLIASFLSRVSLFNIKEGLRWIHKNALIQNV